MLETPRMKLVKRNEEYLNEITSLCLQDFFDDFIEKTSEELKKAEDKLIRNFAEEYDLSLKCARYYIKKNFNLRIMHEYPDGVPVLSVVLEPKSPEEILYDWDTLPVSNECEEELLRNHKDDKWEWIK